MIGLRDIAAHRERCAPPRKGEQARKAALSAFECSEQCCLLRAQLLEHGAQLRKHRLDLGPGSRVGRPALPQQRPVAGRHVVRHGRLLPGEYLEQHLQMQQPGSGGTGQRGCSEYLHVVSLGMTCDLSLQCKGFRSVSQSQCLLGATPCPGLRHRSLTQQALDLVAAMLLGLFRQRGFAAVGEQGGLEGGPPGES